MSAGIVVLMVHGRKSYLVLGREQYAPNWRGAHKWSDFGGQFGDGEAPEAAAAREFFEETLGVFGSLKATLAARDHLFRAVVRRSTARHGVITKHLYVVRLPWDPAAAQRFHGRREHLKHILFTVAQIRRLQRSLSERRLPVPDYLHREPDRMLLISDLDAVEQLGSGRYRIRVRAAAAAADRYFGKFGDATIEATLPVPDDAADDYAKIIELKNWLDRLISAFPADLGARAIAYKDHGPVRAWLPYVRREFLEKDALRAWRLPELAAVVKSHARSKELLRTSFVAPLAIVLRQLGEAPTPAGRPRWAPDRGRRPSASASV